MADNGRIEAPKEACAAGESNRKLRREKCRERLSMSEAERRRLSALIAQRLQRLSEYQRAEYLLVYVSYGAEVFTHELIRRALEENKKVYCPRVEGDNLAFWRIFSFSDLKPGFHGILEPEGVTERFELAALSRHGRAVAIVPGTVFDRMGHRIGYGGGYYDRYLSGLSEGERPFCIGICFACQLAAINPCEHDQSMDLVLFA